MKQGRIGNWRGRVLRPRSGEERVFSVFFLENKLKQNVVLVHSDGKQVARFLQDERANADVKEWDILRERLRQEGVFVYENDIEELAGAYATCP